MIDGLIGAREHTNQTEVVGVQVFGYNDAATLTIGLAGPGTGWVGIGFGREGPPRVRGPSALSPP